MGKTETPGGYEGFSAQEKQMLYELMTHIESDAEVSLELYDDVATKIGNKLELIQVKSASRKDGNPLANKSLALWKTLSNWIEKLKEFEEDGTINVIRCRYSVSSRHALKEGAVSTLFNEAHSAEEAEQAITRAIAAVGEPAEGIKAYVDSFTNSKNRKYAVRIVKMFEYETHLGFDAELQELFHRTSFVSTDLEPGLFKMMCGWLRREVAQHTEHGNAAVVRRSEYCDELRRTSKLRNDNPLIQPVENPTCDEIEAEKDRRPTYLAQLELIGINTRETHDESGLEAITDKLQSNSFIAQLAKNGTISQQGFDCYRTDLVSDWSDVRHERILQGLGDDVSIGQQIYFETRKVTRVTKLQGFDPPRFLTHGQLHALADETDEDLGAPRIGWHPRYAEKLTEKNIGKDIV